MSYEREIRYQETGNRWQMAIYSYDNSNSRNEGRLGDQPAWLRLILDVAKVGGHLTRMRDGPPDRLLWFTIDSNNNLMEITFP